MKRFIVSIFLLLVTPVMTCAEPFVDFYIGRANTDNASVTASQDTTPFWGPGSKITEKRRVDFDPSTTLGVKGGYWFERFPWFGIAGDASYFQANGDDVDIDIYPVSFLLQFRYPILKSSSYPKGILQPYGAVGWTYYLAYMSVDFRPVIPEKVDGIADGTGPDVRLGLSWSLHKNISLFGEYRYTNVNLEIDEDYDYCYWSCYSDEADVDIETSHYLFGLSLGF